MFFFKVSQRRAEPLRAKGHEQARVVLAANLSTDACRCWCAPKLLRRRSEPHHSSTTLRVYSEVL